LILSPKLYQTIATGDNDRFPEIDDVWLQSAAFAPLLFGLIAPNLQVLSLFFAIGRANALFGVCAVEVSTL